MLETGGILAGLLAGADAARFALPAVLPRGEAPPLDPRGQGDARSASHSRLAAAPRPGSVAAGTRPDVCVPGGRLQVERDAYSWVGVWQ